MTDRNYWTSLGRSTSRRNVLRGGGVAGLGLAGAALIGCGDDDANGNGNGTATPGAPTDGTPTGTPAASGEPRQGGTLGMENAIPQDNFNPIVNSGESGGLSSWHVYDMPFTPRVDERQYVLEAAESVEITDETTVVMTLKEGMVYQDKDPVNGRAVSTEDIAIVHEYVREEERAGDPSFQTASLDYVETPDDETIIFHLHQPNAYLFTSTQLGAHFNNGIIPRELVEGDLDRMEPVGSGPYMLDEYQFQVRYEYVRNPTYRQADEGKPYIDRRVRIPMTDGSALEAAFRSEQIHQWIPPSEAADRLVNDLGEQITVNEFTGLNMITWNVSAERDYFDDERVREAFYRAFNAEEHIALVADGWAVPTTGKIPQGLEDYVLDESETAEYLRHDQDEARSLLEAAGWDFDRVYELTTLANPINESQLQVLQEQFRRIGVETQAIVAPAPEWLPNISRTGNYDFAGGVNHPAWDSPQRPMRLHHSESLTIHQAMGMRDSEIDEMIEGTEQILDREEHIEAVKDLQRALIERYSHMHYVYTPIQRELLWGYVRDWEFSATNSVMYRTDAWLDV